MSIIYLLGSGGLTVTTSAIEISGASCSMSPQPTSLKDRKRAAEAIRKRKTNRLLVMIAVIFAASWMPLNISNLLVDLNPVRLTCS